MKVQVSVPGKLYIAGEYAVVEAGYPALIAAIDQYLTVTIESSQRGSIYSSQQDVTVTWSRRDGKISLENVHPYALVLSALEVAEDYVRNLDYATEDCYALSIHSQLDDEQSGVKYGLGSSGAVTVATVRAILTYYGVQADAYLVYQLSSIAQVRLGMTGSFGDLAASSYGGVVAYHSLDRTWLKEVLVSHSLLDILGLPWKDLNVQRLELPVPLTLLIGWTGQAASTDNLIAEVSQHRTQIERATCYQMFLAKSKICVERIIQACRQQEVLVFQTDIQENRQLLQGFARNMGLVIETPALANLCQLAQTEGAVAKSSGAGGGDCGVCFVTGEDQQKRIYQKWQEVGIVPLDFAIAAEIG